MQPTKLEDDARFPSYQRASFPDGSTMLVPRAAGTALLSAGSQATAQASPNMSMPGPVASFSPPGGAPPAPPPAAQDFTPAPQPQAPPTFQVSSQPERRAVDPMDPRTGLYLSDYRDANRPVYVPGRPSVDPHKIVASQVAVPVHRTTQTTTGPGFDPEAVQRYQELEQKAAITHGEAQMLDAHNREQIAQMTATSLAELQAKQQAEQHAAESFYRANMSALEGEARQIAATKIDPDQATRGMSGWQTIGLAIAAGLSGYSNPHGQNQVLNLISQKIDRNIAAQEMNLRTRQGANQSALGRMAQQWGSIEAGRAALKVREFEIAKAKLEATAAQMGLPGDHAKVQGMLQSLDAAQAKDRMALEQAARGQTVVSEQSGYMMPQKAQPGYYRGPTDKEYESRIDRAQGRASKGAEIVGKGLENQTKEGELLGVIPTKEQAQERQQVATRQEHLGTAMSEIANLRTNVHQILSRGGITEDAQGNAHHHGIPGVGMGYNVLSRVPFFGPELADLAASTVGGKDALTIRQQAQEALTYKIKEASGAAFSAAEAERHAKALGQAFLAGEDTFAQALTNFNRAIDEKEHSLRAGAGRAASQSYDADKASLEQEAAASKAGIRGTYRGTVATK
jgi:hypothetical protein